MPTGFTTVSGTQVLDASDTPITGTITFQPVLNNGTPTAFELDGVGTIGSGLVKATLTAGAFSLSLPDVSQTKPRNVGYKVGVITSAGVRVPMYGYECIQPTGATWSLDTFVPNLSAQVTVEAGPSGLSAYQLAVSNGFVGSFVAWLASLQGQNGAGFSRMGPNVDGAILGLVGSNGLFHDMYLAGRGWKFLKAAADFYTAGDFYLNGEFRTSQITRLPPNTAGIRWVITGRDGSIVAAYTNQGWITMEALTALIHGNATIGGTLGVTGAATISGNLAVGGSLSITGSFFSGQLAKLPPNVYGASFAVANPDGSFEFLTNASGIVLPTTAPPNSMGAYANPLKETVLTVPASYAKNSKRNFYVPPVYYRAWNHLPLTGQSLAAANDTYYPVPPSTSQPFSNMMFAPPSGTAGVDTLVNGVSGCTLVPLTGTNYGHPTDSEYETMANGLADSVTARSLQFLHDNPNGNTEHTMIVSNSGIGGEIYLQLCGPTDWNSSNPYYDSNPAGSPSYREMMAQVTLAKSLAATAGKSYYVPCILMAHGEFDAYNSAYYQNLLTWQADMQTGIQTITGQKGTIPLLMMQTATGSMSLTAAYPNVNGHATGGPSSGMTAAVAQLQISLDHPDKFILVAPWCHMPHNDGVSRTLQNSDGYVGGPYTGVVELTIHPTGIGQRMAGGYVGKAYEAVILQGTNWQPPMWISVDVNGTEIDLTYNTNITLDSSYVPNATDGHWGLSYSDPNGTAISTVTQTAPNKLKLILTNPAVSGGLVGYLVADPGSNYSPCGNIHDLDAVPNYYSATDGTPIQNYAVRQITAL